VCVYRLESVQYSLASLKQDHQTLVKTHDDYKTQLDSVRHQHDQYDSYLYIYIYLEEFSILAERTIQGLFKDFEKNPWECNLYIAYN